MPDSWVNPNTLPRPAGQPGLTPAGGPGPSFASIFGGQNPFQSSVTAGINGQPTSFATPSQPNTNYVTPAAATALGRLFGANAVAQNTTGMASPGSPAPSQPMYGLDFGRGDVQDAGMGAFQLQRGDSPELVAQRYQAGLNNSGWGGPAPAAAPPADDIFWDRTHPVSTNAPTPGQAGFFGAPATRPAPLPQQPLNTVGHNTSQGLDAYRLLLQLQAMQGAGQGNPAAGLGGGY